MKVGLPNSELRSGFRKPILFAGKFIVSAACFWYVLQEVNISVVIQNLLRLDPRWLAFAISVAILQIPLFAARWQTIVQSLARQPAQFTYSAGIIATAMCAFFAQVVPTLVSEGIRAWIVTRFGYSWRDGFFSVMIDRTVGVAALAVYVIIILLLPSSLVSLLVYRNIILFAFCVALSVGILALLLARHLAPLFRRWQYTHWIGMFAIDARRVLLGRGAPIIIGSAFAIHLSTIVIIWSLGTAEGLSLSVFDCGVLFVVMIGIALVPISINAWGLREFTVVSLLSAHGLAPDRALLFSLSFGLIFVIATLPGACIWIFYRFPQEKIPASI